MAEIISNYQILDAFDDIAKEKNLPPEVVIETFRQALLTATRKRFGTADNIEVDIDSELGTIKITAKKTVVMTVTEPALEISKKEAKKINENARVGDIIEIEINPADFGRNAIMAAKQNLTQKIRETEREIVFADFRHKIGELISGTVQRIERGNVILSLGKTEGFIPRSEQVSSEHLPIGKTVRAYVKDVRRETSGPPVVLSRKAAEFVKCLFEFEVPEVYEGRVQIVGVSREAGERTKIAVYSTDDRIDPVGACVGLKGTRVQSVVKELSNEKIDIIPYSPDPEVFIQKALAPAEVVGTFLYPDEHKIVVIVLDEQLSLAIGKGGVNARLAARLVGWRLTIYGAEQYKNNTMLLENADFLTPEQKEALLHYDMDTIQKLARMKYEMLRSIEQIGEQSAEILKEARAAVKKMEEENAFVTKDRKLEDTLNNEKNNENENVSIGNNSKENSDTKTTE